MNLRPDVTENLNTGPDMNGLPLQLLSWAPDRHPPGSTRNSSSAKAWLPSAQMERSPFQVIFAPYEPRTRAEEDGMNDLLSRYNVPLSVLIERTQSVTHSFGTTELENGDGHVAWCHFLSKALAVQERDGVLRLRENGPQNDQGSQANSAWITSDYILHTRKNTMSNSSYKSNVTLLCFGAPQSVVARFHRSLDSIGLDACRAPYSVFDTIFEQLYQIVDNTAWTLADVFRPIEHSTLNGARDVTTTSISVDFVGLHNATKHSTYLLEAVEAAIKTLGAMAEHLESACVNKALLHETTKTNMALKYRMRTFESTALRLRSLEKRMANIISLSLHLVQQANNQVMREDSQAMKTIAVMTLIFLPATAVAALFSSPFFAVDFNNRMGPLKVAVSFWIFWAIVLPLTGIVLLLWWVWNKKSQRAHNPSRRLF